MNADPVVMEYFPGTLSSWETDQLIARIETHFEKNQYGLWALEIPAVTPFAGFVGLAEVDFDAPFAPAVEIGWRLAAECWGLGYATEAAAAAMAFGFEDLRLDEIVSFTAAENQPSRRVMERLGMTRDPSDDSDHPSLPEGHPLRRHVLYRKRRQE
jgi:RimJ/RimL family protein N-acetyltransferase